jgi:hypothetical protein
VTSRAYHEGGGLERDLADDYRRHASALHNSYPLLAASLDAMAGSYDYDARREDTQAKLRIEGHSPAGRTDQAARRRAHRHGIARQ